MEKHWNQYYIRGSHQCAPKQRLSSRLESFNDNARLKVAAVALDNRDFAYKGYVFVKRKTRLHLLHRHSMDMIQDTKLTYQDTSADLRKKQRAKLSRSLGEVERGQGCGLRLAIMKLQ